MAKSKVYSSSLLSIDVQEDETTITAEWKGKSIEREPHKFITPILVREIKKCSDRNKRLVLDFQRLEYMNSSTITPIIKILERAKRGTTRITVRYDQAQKWQELIFSALTIFTTKDDRVELMG
jgi:hypothetical protein